MNLRDWLRSVQIFYRLFIIILLGPVELRIFVLATQ